MRPEARAAARAAAVASGKKAKADADAVKKANKAKGAVNVAQGKSRISSKQGNKGAQQKVQPSSR